MPFGWFRHLRQYEFHKNHYSFFSLVVTHYKPNLSQLNLAPCGFQWARGTSSRNKRLCISCGNRSMLMPLSPSKSDVQTRLLPKLLHETCQNRICLLEMFQNGLTQRGIRTSRKLIFKTTSLWEKTCYLAIKNCLAQPHSSFLTPSNKNFTISPGRLLKKHAKKKKNIRIHMKKNSAHRLRSPGSEIFMDQLLEGGKGTLGSSNFNAVNAVNGLIHLCHGQKSQYWGWSSHL